MAGVQGAAGLDSNSAANGFAFVMQRQPDLARIWGEPNAIVVVQPSSVFDSPILNTEGADTRLGTQWLRNREACILNADADRQCGEHGGGRLKDRVLLIIREADRQRARGIQLPAISQFMLEGMRGPHHAGAQVRSERAGRACPQVVAVVEAETVTPASILRPTGKAYRCRAEASYPFLPIG